MKKNVFQKVVSVLACVAVICCTGLAWAANFEACTFSRSSAGSAYSGGSMGSMGSSGSVGSTGSTGSMGRSGGSFNPVSAFNNGMTAARTTVATTTAAPINTGSPVKSGVQITGPAGSLNTFTSTYNISRTGGITNKTTPDTIIKCSTDVAATGAVTNEITKPVVTSITALNPDGQSNILKNFGTNPPSVVKYFANNMTFEQQMAAMSEGNSSIWHYQETCNDIGPDGKPVWQSAKSVFADIVQAMSTTGQIKDAEGNIITNSPFGNNGAGYFADSKIAPGPKANGSWDIVNAAANEWFAKHNVNLSCGLQEAQWENFLNDMEINGYIDRLSPAESKSMYLNPSNTRENMEAFLKGQTVTQSPGHWQTYETGTFFKSSPAGNNPWDGFIDTRSFTCQYMEVNMDATAEDWANAEATFEMLYGNLSCYSDSQLADLRQDFYEREGLIKPLRFFL